MGQGGWGRAESPRADPPDGVGARPSPEILLTVTWGRCGASRFAVPAGGGGGRGEGLIGRGTRAKAGGMMPPSFFRFGQWGSREGKGRRGSRGSYPRSRRAPPPRAQGPGPASALPPAGAFPPSAAGAATSASARSAPPRAPAAAWTGVVTGAPLSHPPCPPEPGRRGVPTPSDGAASQHPPTHRPAPAWHPPDEALVHHGIGQPAHGRPGAAQPLHLCLPQLLGLRNPRGPLRWHRSWRQHLGRRGWRLGRLAARGGDMKPQVDEPQGLGPDLCVLWAGGGSVLPLCAGVGAWVPAALGSTCPGLSCLRGSEMRENPPGVEFGPSPAPTLRGTHSHGLSLPICQGHGKSRPSQAKPGPAAPRTHLCLCPPSP